MKWSNYPLRVRVANTIFSRGATTPAEGSGNLSLIKVMSLIADLSKGDGSQNALRWDAPHRRRAKKTGAVTSTSYGSICEIAFPGSAAGLWAVAAYHRAGVKRNVRTAATPSDSAIPATQADHPNLSNAWPSNAVPIKPPAK